MQLRVSWQKRMERIQYPFDCSDFLSMCGAKIHDSRDLNKMSSCPPCWISTILKARGSLPPVRFSSQLSQDQGSRPLITHPSQNKTARFGALSQQHKVKICLLRKGTQKTCFFPKKRSPYPTINLKKMFSFFRLEKACTFTLHQVFSYQAFIFEGSVRCDKELRCHDHKAGTR